MFNLIVENKPTAWETDQLMRIDKDRFGEYSGHEGEPIGAKEPNSLTILERCPAFLMYEEHSQAVNRDLIRYGKVKDIVVRRSDITFLFEQQGTFSRDVMKEFGDRLDIHDWEWNRIHWAVKDGGIPSAMLERLELSKEVVPKTVALFISHASEDKKAFVRPLAAALKAKGFAVWFDEYELTMGDSLLQKIDDGLKRSDYGVVVLSPSFFKKDWPTRELDGLLALESENKKLILPVWLGVGREEVAQFSPILAGRVGGKGENGVAYIVDEIQKAVSVSGRMKEVTTGGAKNALRTLTAKLAAKDHEKKRLDCTAGTGEVTEAAERLVDEIVREIESANEGGKKRFSVRRATPDSVNVGGPNRVLISTVLREIYVNTAERAEFYVRIGQGNRVAPHPANVEMLEELIFLPRIVDDSGIKWEEKASGGKIMTLEEATERTIGRFVHHIESQGRSC